MTTHALFCIVFLTLKTIIHTLEFQSKGHAKASVLIAVSREVRKNTKESMCS